MPTNLMRLPTDIAQIARKHFQRHYQTWLQTTTIEPITIPLGVPTEATVQQNLALFKQWLMTWRDWQGVGKLQWLTRQWPQLGTQRLPSQLHLNTLADIVQWADLSEQWQGMHERYQVFVTRWPQLAVVAAKQITALHALPAQDVKILLATLTWLLEHDTRPQFMRQLPIPGMHTKWLQQHKRLLQALLAVLLPASVQQTDTEQGKNDLANLLGIPAEAIWIRLQILCARLRSKVGGLRYLSVPHTELQQLNLDVQHVFIIENIQTGLALQDLPNAVVIMGLGYAVQVLANIPWLANKPCYYWGDIDTHGFAILNRARRYLPQLTSFLMDKQTLFSMREFWGKENQPIKTDILKYLTVAEMDVYSALRDNRWGEQIRFEQEQLTWSLAWETILALTK